MFDRSLRADDQATEMIEKYADMVYKLAYAQVRNRQDADDIFQEVFIRLVQYGEAFESEEHEKAWLIRVTINCTRNMWLSAWRRRMVFMEDEAWNKVAAEEAPEENEELAEALDALPVKYRRVIHLFYYEEMSVEQIAQVLGDKPATIRSRLTRARKALKEKMQKKSGREAKRRV